MTTADTTPERDNEEPRPARRMRTHRGEAVALPDRCTLPTAPAPGTQLGADWLPFAPGTRIPPLPAAYRFDLNADNTPRPEPAEWTQVARLGDDGMAGTPMHVPIAISPCERLAATLSLRNLIIWSLPLGRPVRTIDLTGSNVAGWMVRSMVFGTILASRNRFTPCLRGLVLGGEDAHVVDLIAGKRLAELHTDTAILPSAERLEIGARYPHRSDWLGSTTTRWPAVDDPTQLGKPMLPPVVTADGRRVAWIGHTEVGATLQIRDVATGRCLRLSDWLGPRVEAELENRGPHWSRFDSNMVEFGWESGLRVRATIDPDEPIQIGQFAPMRVMGVSNDGRHAVVRGRGRTHVVRFPGDGSAEPEMLALARSLPAESIAILSPSGSFMLVGGPFQALRILTHTPATDRRPGWYRVRRGAPQHETIRGFGTVALATNGSTAVISDVGPTLAIVEAETGRVRARIDSLSPRLLNISPRGSAIGAVSAAEEVDRYETYDARADPPVRVGSFEQVGDISGLSDDGTVMVGRGRDRSRQVRLWRGNEPSSIHRFAAKGTALLTGDGRFVFTFDTPTIGDLWRIRSNAVSHVARYHMRRVEPSACLTPNGSRIWLSLPEGPRVLDPRTGTLSPTKLAPVAGQPRDRGANGYLIINCPWPNLCVRQTELGPVELYRPTGPPPGDHRKTEPRA